MDQNKTVAIKPLKRARLCLGGAIIGTALSSYLGPLFGVPGDHASTQVVGAAGGTLLAAVLLKLANVVV